MGWLPQRAGSPSLNGGGTAAAIPHVHRWRHIPFTYRLYGSILNLRRLQAQTKVSTDTVYELQYADDAALPSHSPSDLQENLNTLADGYHRAGLIINTKKTEILSLIQHSSPSSQLSFTLHGDVLNTTQLPWQYTFI